MAKTVCIPIKSETLDLIEVMNNGVRPQIEDEVTYFVYQGDGRFNEIIDLDEACRRMAASRGILTPIFVVDE